MKKSNMDEIYIGKTVSPFESIGKSQTIDRKASNFYNTNEEVQIIKRLIKKGEHDEDITRYIPGTLELATNN